MVERTIIEAVEGSSPQDDTALKRGNARKWLKNMLPYTITTQIKH